MSCTADARPCLQMEMDRCQLPMLDDTGLDDLKPHTHHALQGLHRLPDILDVVPPPVIWPTTPDEAQVSCFGQQQ